MPAKRELFPEEIQEIISLRGVESAASIRKRFRIGTSRLYRIWKNAERKGSSSRSSSSKSRRSGRRQGPCCGAVCIGDFARLNRSASRGARKPFRRCGRSGRTTRGSPKKAFSTPSKKAATLFEKRPTSLFLLAMLQRPPPVASSKLS